MWASPGAETVLGAELPGLFVGEVMSQVGQKKN